MTASFDEWEASRRPWMVRPPAKVCALEKPPVLTYCEWCGFKVQGDVCEVPPPDLCEKAVNMLYITAP